MHRLLVDPARIEGDVATVDGGGLRHLSRVLRLGEGDELEVFDGAGRAWLARIERISAEEATLRLGTQVVRTAAPRITLAQGLAKGEKMELVIQKATELGAARIVPLALSRSVVKLDASRAADRTRRWRKIAEEAARQCGRADVPEVDEPRTLQRFVEEAAERGESIAVLWEEARDERLGRWLEEKAGRPLAMVVGPEGGITPEEAEFARGRGAALVGLGARILRTETAGIVALAIAAHRAGELG